MTNPNSESIKSIDQGMTLKILSPATAFQMLRELRVSPASLRANLSPNNLRAVRAAQKEAHDAR